VSIVWDKKIEKYENSAKQTEQKKIRRRRKQKPELVPPIPLLYSKKMKFKKK